VAEQYTDEEKDKDETGEDPKNPLQISDNDNDDEDNIGETSGNAGEERGNTGEGGSNCWVKIVT
jgi:hypothetical protein